MSSLNLKIITHALFVVVVVVVFGRTMRTQYTACKPPTRHAGQQRQHTHAIRHILFTHHLARKQYISIECNIYILVAVHRRIYFVDILLIHFI